MDLGALVAVPVVVPALGAVVAALPVVASVPVGAAVPVVGVVEPGVYLS